MKPEEIHIQILFQYAQPEIMKKTILYEENHGTQGKFYGAAGTDKDGISQDFYLRYARSVRQERSIDELIQYYRELQNWFESVNGRSIFDLPASYAQKVLSFRNMEPLCRQEEALNWRMQSLAIGQDIFICAGLAKEDVKRNFKRKKFYWPAVVGTDSAELDHLLQQGLAENHFHLNGSTQIFPLAWGFLMNHPEEIRKYFSDQKFAENLNKMELWGEMDIPSSWTDRIYDAAWLRLTLFNYIVNPAQRQQDIQTLAGFAGQLNKKSYLYNNIQLLRFVYGEKFKQIDGQEKCLDYAICREILDAEDGSYRFLQGERGFLYNGFYRIFTGEFGRTERNYFYLYLLIKLRFREELIQLNQRKGFRNFSDYQDRKGHLWSRMKEYQAEAYRLSVRSATEEYVRSLELRVGPGETSKENVAYINRLDKNINFQIVCKNEDEKKFCEDKGYFYVIHFIKSQEKLLDAATDSFKIMPKNQKVRRKVEKQAKALAKAFSSSSYICERIRGIDAASHEIGCRPEIFATAFRFLRQCIMPKEQGSQIDRYWPTIGRTYHAGEDFLDITDGLRAIDEAICFLDLDRGDRLGHALALGFDPKTYYQRTEQCVLVPAQDVLDNLIWVFYRSMGWGVPVPIELHVWMKDYITKLLMQIYGVASEADMRAYYESWSLRGDDPELYRGIGAEDSETVEIIERKVQNWKCSWNYYDPCRLSTHLWGCADVEVYRKKPEVIRLLYAYHYGKEQRLKGQREERFEPHKDYAELLYKLQNCMMEKLMIKGISIECNLSSNYLIGLFRRYDEHPILRFNNYGLNFDKYKKENVQLHVSLNTDDQGVFDTSLKNEYMLLYACLQKYRDKDGKRVFNDDQIKDYLEHLRRMGQEATFPKAKEE